MDFILKQIQTAFGGPLTPPAPPPLPPPPPSLSPSLVVPLNPTVTASPPLPTHPYYPVDANIVGYQRNDRSPSELISIFGSGCAVILCLTFMVVKRARPHASMSDFLTAMWFVLSGCSHLFFEGYFVYNFQRIAGMQDLFGQLWKEYALSDSRYLSQDPFVLCVESVTVAFFGPLSFVTAGLIAIDHPLRLPFQAIVSIGHLYSDTLYYATSAYAHNFVGISYSRPEAQYFWGYFIILNAFWIVVPFILLYKSVSATGRAFAALNKLERTLKSSSIERVDGDAKKLQ